jgi:hypothetical protein
MDFQGVIPCSLAVGTNVVQYLDISIFLKTLLPCTELHDVSYQKIVILTICHSRLIKCSLPAVNLLQCVFQSIDCPKMQKFAVLFTVHSNTGVPPHLLIQYSWFTAAPESFKIKEINGL